MLSAGTRLIGSQSVACISSETLSGSDEEDEVVASLTEMVSPFMLSSNLSWSLWFTAYNHNYRFGIVAVVWLGRRVVVLLDLQSTGRVAARCRVQPWASCSHTWLCHRVVLIWYRHKL